MSAGWSRGEGRKTRRIVLNDKESHHHSDRSFVSIESPFFACRQTIRPISPPNDSRARLSFPFWKRKKGKKQGTTLRFRIFFERDRDRSVFEAKICEEEKRGWLEKKEKRRRIIKLWQIWNVFVPSSVCWFKNGTKWQRERRRKSMSNDVGEQEI